MKNNVYNDLKNRILNGEFEFGESLKEIQLSEYYNISRTPIREVLWKLYSDGLIEHEENKGYVVEKIDGEKVVEIFEARQAIEGMAARLACESGDENFHDKITAIEDELKITNVINTPQKGIELGEKLHREIMINANNSILEDFMSKLNNHFTLIRNMTKKSPSIESNSKEYHLKIISAIKAGNEEKAEKIMREHLKVTCSSMLEEFYPKLKKFNLL